MAIIKKFSQIDTEVLKRLIIMNFQQEVGKNVDWNDDLKFIIINFLKMINGDPYQFLDPVTKKIITTNIPKSIFVAGGVGSGKTTLIKSLFKALKEYNVYYNTPIEETKYYFQNKIFSITDLMQMYCSDNYLPVTESVICIDDLPDKNITFQYMGNKTDLEKFIQARYLFNYTFTYFTSNFPLSKNYLDLDERTISRLNEMCAYYELKHEDFRMIK